MVFKGLYRSIINLCLFLPVVQCLSHPFHNVLRLRRNQQVGVRTQGYKTEPTFMPQKFKVDYPDQKKDLLSPGFIFVSMMWKLGAPFGPQIYSMDGDIVWYGSVLANRVQDFKLCDYSRTKAGVADLQLCWSERENAPNRAKPFVHKVFMAGDYTLIRNLTLRSDLHDMTVTDDGRSLLTMDFTWTDMDLSEWNGPKDGRFKDGCILEYDLTSTKLIFEWCYSKHFPLWETKIFFHARPQVNATSNIAGKGTKENPWDPLHLNSVDKNQDGDYLASIRHLNQIIKVAGPRSASGKDSGTVLWRLGGFSNQFKTDFNFSMQHDVQYVSTDNLGDTITLFDNAWEGVHEPSANYSSGKIIRVENKTMTARILREYPHPHGALSKSRGSMQILDNGNAFVGWGALPEVTEFTEEGTPIYHSRFDTDESKQFSYRSYKFPWLGTPPWPPKVVVYSRFCLEERRPIYVYVSWNGATQVKSWRLATSSSENGPWKAAGVHKKQGFETRIKLNEPARFVSVEAIDVKDNVLSKATQKTFHPPSKLAHKCDQFGCPDHFDYITNSGRQDSCQTAPGFAFIPICMLVLLSELLAHLKETLLFALVEKKTSSASIRLLG